MANSINEIRSFVAKRVAEGFQSTEEIIHSTVECFEVQANEELCREIARLTGEQMAEHMRSQSQWPETTDCDRLDWAFEDLDRSGIVARQNFTCCCNCGQYEIGDEIRQARAKHPVEGYVFYHMQDTESAVVGGSFYLAYGSVEKGENALTAVGRKIVLSLERAGLRTEWNGRSDTRIRVVDFDWKRRR